MVLGNETEFSKPDPSKTIVEWMQKSGQIRTNGKFESYSNFKK